MELEFVEFDHLKGLIRLRTIGHLKQANLLSLNQFSSSLPMQSTETTTTAAASTLSTREMTRSTTFSADHTAPLTSQMPDVMSIDSSISMFATPWTPRPIADKAEHARGNATFLIGITGNHLTPTWMMPSVAYAARWAYRMMLWSESREELNQEAVDANVTQANARVRMQAASFVSFSHLVERFIDDDTIDYFVFQDSDFVPKRHEWSLAFLLEDAERRLAHSTCHFLFQAVGVYDKVWTINSGWYVVKRSAIGLAFLRRWRRNMSLCPSWLPPQGLLYATYLEFTAAVAYGPEYNTTELMLKCCNEPPVLYGQGKCFTRELREATAVYRQRIGADDDVQLPSLADGICLMYHPDFQVNVHMWYRVGNFASHSHETVQAFGLDLQWTDKVLMRKLPNGTLVEADLQTELRGIQNSYDKCRELWPYARIGTFGKEGP